MLKAVRVASAMLVALVFTAAGHAQTSKPSKPSTPAPQFELAGASDDWLLFRESIRDAREPLADCNYPGLSGGTRGLKLHFLKLSEAHKSGDLVPVARFDSSFAIYQPAGDASACTSPDISARRRRAAEAFASSVGVTISQSIRPLAVFGSAVSAKACEPLKKRLAASACDASYTGRIDGKPIRIARLLTAVPRAPDYNTCQFLGHRFMVAVQVSWLDLGEPESRSVPGGFAEHYDCRPQLFMPIQLYALPDQVVLLASFRGDNVADRSEYPHVIVMPRNP
jgi:hypothetical protein